jgi:hypothetical protein
MRACSGAFRGISAGAAQKRAKAGFVCRPPHAQGVGNAPWFRNIIAANSVRVSSTIIWRHSNNEISASTVQRHGMSNQRLFKKSINDSKSDPRHRAQPTQTLLARRSFVKGHPQRDIHESLAPALSRGLWATWLVGPGARTRVL